MASAANLVSSTSSRLFPPGAVKLVSGLIVQGRKRFGQKLDICVKRYHKSRSGTRTPI